MRKFTDVFVGTLLIGIAVVGILVALILWGVDHANDSQTTERQRVDACSVIKDEALKTLCINGH